ncbi:hypothetical protein A2930_02980 [Candidatus Giovannonibacteria bacterium RIFCSPLOWO2_01_FULL_45_34]|uniref:Uncharacterized protein n=1 Tax=Candidatus Giovannonibacteria bacterium RIFCSPLOWO2_01_FULL_45_34 TaxID=1798351 RepID=A0A1F5WZ83_9BACT|nr:MAG: hypothetical protein A3C73_03730 [Candidatus Giovannonibacteria bacterium RIFCSPHIGHO2_02_FULL_44_11]OGF80621.1 MAG: hypothetical protein A2930_02980 [Candidatus Giovannonibacteria bacterium RIFCSPLOWO2_01_FULL_45_34]
MELLTNEQIVDMAGFFPSTREGHGGIKLRKVRGNLTTCRMGCNKESEKDAKFHGHSQINQAEEFLGIGKKRKKVADRKLEEAMKALGGIFWAEGGHAGSGGEILPLEPGDKVRIVLTPLQIKHGAHEEYPMNGVGIAIGRVQEERLVVVKLNKPFSPKGEGSVTEINVPASLLQRAE